MKATNQTITITLTTDEARHLLLALEEREASFANRPPYAVTPRGESNEADLHQTEILLATIRRQRAAEAITG